ncbi:MAG: DUF4330 domain-containing protein [Symploca sp. SIO2C1]|nr:DUF4330 domain-containing protein [Symploca sp. SIO2C1]
MAILDSKGRLFGKVSILDLGAALVILAVFVGITFGTTGTVAQLNDTRPVEVEVLVRGLSVRDPKALMAEFNEQKKTNIVIRNQPYGQIEIKSVKQLPRTLAVPQPDGSVKELDDPRGNSFSANLLIVLAGQGQITENGPVLGNIPVKIGTPVELEGPDYNFNASTIAVKVN